MKVYIAARYTRKFEMQILRDVLKSMGIEVTSSWLGESHNPNIQLSELTPSEMKDIAYKDYHDIDEATDMIFFAEEGATPRGGRHVEFGYAFAKGKHIYVVGPWENIFHYTDGITHVGDVLFLLRDVLARADF